MNSTVYVNNIVNVNKFFENKYRNQPDTQIYVIYQLCYVHRLLQIFHHMEKISCKYLQILTYNPYFKYTEVLSQKYFFAHIFQISLNYHSSYTRKQENSFLSRP
ncbi:hypothetical protein PanWU01x14_185350 [Parasponia andersonii]|uniref:Uncharacterized protein n=1 Tax=Parasponia andersonii TaxID=3476 RepID=A0A2P5C480_PARAD|nr:hypothetical protein PanWU01x14_185350 [Parasponia andersonii]